MRRQRPAAVGRGCEVLVRSIRPEGESDVRPPAGLCGADGEVVVAIAEEIGLYQLATRPPLGRALLTGRVRAGERVVELPNKGEVAR